jgi:acetyltransferase-like isoleucine patch superfamily enzyme
MANVHEINNREILEFCGYNGRLGLLKFHTRFFFSWILQTLAKVSPHPGISRFCQKMRGVNIGGPVYIGPNVHIDDLYPELITIEDYVSVGMGTMIFAHSNPTCSVELKTKYFPRKVEPTIIKKGAWVAPGSIILSGITIGENSVVGAGSVVIKDVPPYTIVGGSPAKIIKKLE